MTSIYVFVRWPSTLCMSPAHRQKNAALLTGITLSHKLEIAAEGKMGTRERKSRKFPKYANGNKGLKVNHVFFILK